MTCKDEGLVSEFVCVSCAIEVTAFGLNECPVPPQCATCLWLDEFIADPVERERLGRQIDPERPVKVLH